MEAVAGQTSTARELRERNHRFYDALWSDARLVEPERFNTWPLVTALLPASGPCLEVAPGLRPRLPLERAHFVDISGPALAKLRARGARTAIGEIAALPFGDGAFAFACAFDVIEHVDDDDGALAEISRVMRPGARLILSIPVHATRWTPFDDLVGHKRRYEPGALEGLLARHDLAIESSAAFGMQPRSSRAVDFGMWWLMRHPEVAMRWYNRAFMPLALRFQKPLRLHAGLIETASVDELLLVCRRGAR